VSDGGEDKSLSATRIKRPRVTCIFRSIYQAVLSTKYGA